MDGWSSPPFTFNLDAAAALVVPVGPHRGRCVGELSDDDLRRLGSSRSSAEGMKEVQAFARAKIALIELGSLVAPMQQKPTPPKSREVCTILSALPKQPRADRTRVKVQSWATDLRIRGLCNGMRVLYTLALLFLVIVLYPPVAAAPAYILGWSVMMCVSRLKSAARIFYDTLVSVMGKVFDDTIGALFVWPLDHLGQDAYPMGGSVLFMLFTWMVSRRITPAIV